MANYDKVSAKVDLYTKGRYLPTRVRNSSGYKRSDMRRMNKISPGEQDHLAVGGGGWMEADEREIVTDSEAQKMPKALVDAKKMTKNAIP